MELRHLRYFIAVAELLHFGRAAARLRIAQPSLSQQIRHLEQELGTPLLSRTRRSVALTDAGRAFLEQARDIVARASRAAVAARRLGEEEAGTLRIGIGHYMNQSVVLAAVGTFHRRSPKTHIEILTLPVQRQLAALREERLDVGFVLLPVSDPVFGTELVSGEPLSVALPARHRLSRRPRLALASLAAEPFVVVSRDLVPVYHDIVLAACREAGFVPLAPHEADQLPMVLGMVAAGAGVALVPAFVQALRPPGVVLRPLRPPVPTLQTAIAWRRDNASPSVPLLLESLRQVMRTRATAQAR